MVLPNGYLCSNLAVKRRIAAKTRLEKWRFIDFATCPLCQEKDRNMDHLFFECSFVATLWDQLLAWQGIIRTSLKWKIKVHWGLRFMKERGSKAQVYRMTLISAIYSIWLECNARVFQLKQKTSSLLDK